MIKTITQKNKKRLEDIQKEHIALFNKLDGLYDEACQILTTKDKDGFVCDFLNSSYDVDQFLDYVKIGVENP